MGSPFRTLTRGAARLLSVVSEEEQQEEVEEKEEVNPDKFDWNGQKLTIDYKKMGEVTPRQGWTQCLTDYLDSSKADKEQVKLEGWFHLGRGFGKASDHAWVAHQQQIKPWIFIIVANWAAWKKLSMLVVTLTATSAFMAEQNALTEKIKNSAWGRKAKPVLDVSEKVAGLSRTARIMVNNDKTMLGWASGFLILYGLAPTEFGAVPFVSILDFTLTIGTGMAIGHYLGADGLASSEVRAQGSEGDRVEMSE